MTDQTATATQKLHFYQKGTFTVGNRLVPDAERSVQASIDRSNALTCGHRACQGCGETLGHAVIAAVLAHVVVRPGRRGFNRFDPQRFELIWRY